MKRISDIFLISICLIFVSVFGISIFTVPKSDFSLDENRALETLDGISLGDTISGELSERLSNFFCDQFPLRRSFTSLKASTELTLGRGENNGVIFGKSGYLMIKPKYADMSLYYENLESIKEFCRGYEESGIDTAVFFAPRAVDVLGVYLPDGYADGDMDEPWAVAYEKIPELESVNAELYEAAARGEYVWYRTDHHWSSLGAYYAYAEICEEFGIFACPRSDIVFEKAAEGFCGSVYSKAGVSEVCADDIYICRDTGSDYISVNYDTGEVRDGLYFREYVEKKDKYSIFLGGNHGHMGVYSAGERETLLVIKDSFANSAIPYLARNFNLEIYDLRYFNGAISEEIEKIAPDKILILYGIDTVLTDASPKRLAR